MSKSKIYIGHLLNLFKNAQKNQYLKVQCVSDIFRDMVGTIYKYVFISVQSSENENCVFITLE